MEGKKRSGSDQGIELPPAKKLCLENSQTRFTTSASFHPVLDASDNIDPPRISSTTQIELVNISSAHRSGSALPTQNQSQRNLHVVNPKPNQNVNLHKASNYTTSLNSNEKITQSYQMDEKIEDHLVQNEPSDKDGTHLDFTNNSNEMDYDDEFEKILAMRAKRPVVPARQLHHPKTTNQSTSSIQLPKATSLFQSASSEMQQPKSTSLFQSASNEIQPNESLFQSASREIQQPKSTSLFQSASSEMQQPKATSLFQSASSEMERPKSTSLFQSASSEIQPNGSLFQSASSEMQIPKSTSLFQSASSEMQQPKATSLFQSASSEMERPKSTSLFQSASSEIQIPKTISLFQSASSEMQQPKATSLFQSASNEIQIPKSTSLFQSASSEMERPKSTSLFQSASNEIQPNGSLFQSTSTEIQQPKATSLFQSASNEMEQPNKTSLFQSASNEEPTNNHISESKTDDLEDFDSFLSHLKKNKQATFQTPFKSAAKETIFDVVSTEQNPELDEFEIFMANLKAKKTGANQSSSSATKHKTPKKSAPPRKFGTEPFKKPRPLINHPSKIHQSNHESKNLADEKETLTYSQEIDDLYYLLNNNPEELKNPNQSDPIQESIKSADIEEQYDDQIAPKTPSFRKHRKLHPSVSESVPYNMLDEQQTESVNDLNPKSVSFDQELLEGFDTNEDFLFSTSSQRQTKPPTPRNKFYSSQSSNSPASKSQSPAQRIPRSKNSVVSSPYSLTSKSASNAVTTSPNQFYKTVNPERVKPKLNAPFIPPSSIVSDSGAKNQSPVVSKQHKNVIYSASSSTTNQKSNAVKPLTKPIFNLHLTDEQKSKRKSLANMGQGDRVPLGLNQLQLRAYKLRLEVIGMSSDSARHFKFSNLDNDGNYNYIGYEHFYDLLIAEGASKKLLTMDWIENHFRWIVWKLASMERSFPQDFANIYLTPERTLYQLKYRYEREINMAQRPALRKILEHDSVASRHLVLVVSAIRNDGRTQNFVTGDTVGASSATEHLRQTNQRNGQSRILDDTNPVNIGGDSAIIEVSDGWYCVNAICDPYLTQLVQDGRIFPGQKLHIFGASIVGNDNPTPPLEVTPTTMLKLQINGTKRAKWSTRLGFQPVALPRVRISSLKPGGGIAPRIDAIILRVYPFLFNEEIPKENAEADNQKDVIRITRNLKGEEAAFSRYLKRKEDWLELKSIELQREILIESNSISTEQGQTNMNLMTDIVLDNQQQELLARRLNEAAESEKWLDRNVVSNLKLLICDYPGDPGTLAHDTIEYLAKHGHEGLVDLTSAQRASIRNLGKATLTVWRVSEDDLSRFKEGQRIVVSYVNHQGKPPPTASLHSLASVNAHFDPHLVEDDPSQNSNGLQPIPLGRLSSSTYTSFDFPPHRDDPMCSALSTMFGRTCTPFDQLSSRLRLRDVPPPESPYDIEGMRNIERRRFIERFVISEEFDTIGVVVSLGTRLVVKKSIGPSMPPREEIQQDIFLADPSKLVLVLRVQTIEDNFPSSCQIGTVLSLKNAVYEGFDNHIGAHTASNTDSTEFIFKSACPHHLQLRKKQLDEWMESPSYEEDMELLSAKVVDIQAGVSSKAKPSVNPDNLVYKRNFNL